MAFPIIAAAGIGILSRLAPVARTVYQGIKANRAVNNPVTRFPFKATGTVLKNPSANLLSAGYIAQDLPSNFREIGQNYQDKNYDLMLGNMGLTSLEILGLPYLLRRGTKSNLFRGKVPFTKVGSGELPSAKSAAVKQKKLAKKIGNVIGEDKYMGTKLVGSGTAFVGGYGSELGLFDDLLASTPIQKDTKDKDKVDSDSILQPGADANTTDLIKSTTPNNRVNLKLDKAAFASNIADQMADTEDLVALATSGKKDNVVDQELIGATNTQINTQIKNNLTDVDKIMGGEEGPKGPLGGNLVEADDVKQDNQQTNAGDILNTSTDTNLAKNKMLTSLFMSQKLMLPGQFARIEEQIQKNYQNSSDKLDEYRTGLLEQERKTFDEFIGDFKERSGLKDYNKKQQDYILLKLGLDLMSGKSYEGGVSGFLDILGSAGADAVDSLGALQASESELMQGMALKYDEYLNTLDQQLSDNEKYLFETDLGIMQQRDDGMLELHKSKVEASMRLDEMYMEALMKQINQQGGNDYDLYQDDFGVKVLNPDALFGMEFYRVSRNKGDNRLYIIPRMGKAYPADSVGVADENTYEFKQTAIDKAFNQIHYASDGQHLINLFFATVSEGNLLPGSDANIADTASNLVGVEQFIRSITGDILPRTGTTGGTDKTSLYIDKIENNTGEIFKVSKLNNTNIEKIIMENAALSDPNEKDTQQYMLNQYREDIAEAQNYGNTALGKDFKGERRGDTWADHIYKMVIPDAQQKKMSPKEQREKLEEIKKALARYKVIETNLTYIVANANKAEDRLTQKDIEEAKKLTEAIVNKDTKVILEKYRLLETRLNRNFEKNAKVLLSSISETPASLLQQFGHMKILRQYQAQQALKARGEEVKDLSEMSNYDLFQLFKQGK
tara:strand:- start:3541 stop:6234 length:2694 start_codon:yes stop_codon:yes gene_type:complete